MGRSGISATYVYVYLKGIANEFIIEPKKSTGSVLSEINSVDGFEGSDIFFTELWSLEFQF